MGMLIHRTWLEQQKAKEEKKPVAKVAEPKEEPVKQEEPKEVKKPGRRKTK